MKTHQKILGTLAIPVLTGLLLWAVCLSGGKTLIGNRTSFNYFMLYTAIVMITTIALSINLNSGRFDTNVFLKRLIIYRC